MQPQTPSVSRAVHYVSHGSPVRADGSQAYTSECRAATITETTPDGATVGLCVLNPTGMFFNRGVAHDPGHAHTEEPQMCTKLYHEPGTWHWPTRV